MASKKGSAGDAVPEPSTDIPETRQHARPPSDTAASEAPERHSAAELDAPLVYSDDSPIAAKLRQIDRWVGIGEQAILVALIATIVLTAASVSLLDKIAGIHLGHKDEIMRAGTFALAMFGAAFASHQQRHLAMDMVSRRLTPRGRLFVRAGIAAVVVVIVFLLVRTGMALRANELKADANQGSSDSLVPSGQIAALIPIGGVLIIFHTLVHALIDVDYIRRGKTPPERMRSGH